VIFLKGCPLRCPWCHNPESLEPEIEPDLTTPGKFFGRKMSVEEVLDVVEKDRAFYDASGGGMTISGGEPMMQFDFTRDLLTAAHGRGLHTCLDTSGYAPAEQLLELLPVTDLYHYDYKATDPQKHHVWTGVELPPILDNLDQLYRAGANIILRCPMIPGVNDDHQHLQAIAALMKKYERLAVEILSYHNMARDKWARIGKENPMPDTDNPGKEIKDSWRSTLLATGCDMTRLIVV
jgi:pyruvate formate lyase activating enzyme